MTALKGQLAADEVSFRRMAAFAGIVSLPLAAANLVTMFAAVHFDLNAIAHPLILIRYGASGAELWRWAMVLDILGYYLLVVPVIVTLRSVLRRGSPNWMDLSALCLLAYCFIGAMGGAILATAIPPLITGYATAGAHQAALETVLNGYSNAVFRGMWNLLEEFLAAIGWIGMGRVLRPMHPRLGQATTLLGLACLADSLGTAVNIDAVATTGLTIYLVLAPIWACWLGVRLLRHRAPFAASGEAINRLAAPQAHQAADAAVATGGQRERSIRPAPPSRP
jgi:hypothetical protein